jgi:hypothetical protein
MGMFNKGQQTARDGGVARDEATRGDGGAPRDTGYDSPSDPYDKVGNAEITERGVFVLPGIYPLLYCDVLKMIRSFKGADLFIAEFDILESNVPERPAGTKVSWIANFAHLPTPGNVRAFLAALMGVDPEEVDRDGAKYACSKDNPCRGRLVRLQAGETTTRAGGNFTVCNWSTIPKEIQDQAEALRIAAGFAPF